MSNKRTQDKREPGYPHTTRQARQELGKRAERKRTRHAAAKGKKR